ncbi:hypothetical protein BDZ97DRAFT_2045242 [Flammula alnicola]|nr:hypothetical protein BDZ97DRAFT_2045242 [Flammula alnicola]
MGTVKDAFHRLTLVPLVLHFRLNSRKREYSSERSCEHAQAIAGPTHTLAVTNPMYAQTGILFMKDIAHAQAHGQKNAVDIRHYQKLKYTQITTQQTLRQSYHSLADYYIQGCMDVPGSARVNAAESQLYLGVAGGEYPTNSNKVRRACVIVWGSIWQAKISSDAIAIMIKSTPKHRHSGRNLISYAEKIQAGWLYFPVSLGDTVDLPPSRFQVEIDALYR